MHSMRCRHLRGDRPFWLLNAGLLEHVLVVVLRRWPANNRMHTNCRVCTLFFPFTLKIILTWFPTIPSYLIRAIRFFSRVCSACTAGTYQVTPLSGYMTQACMTCAACSAGQQISSSCTATANTGCSSCAAGTFQATALTGYTAQGCTGTCTISSCSAGQQINGCTATAE
jgi:hypothetical protein